VRLTLGCKKLANAQSANVIGDVVGSEKPDEVLLLGAHLDSWDLGPGALDDGAGIAMVLESARFLAVSKDPMRRTVRVVLYANEEFGVSGGGAYATAHKAELAKHVMALEADLGGGRAYGVTFTAAASATTLIRDLLSPLSPLGISAATTGGDYGADIGALRRAGVPVAEIEQDLSSYFDYHHAADDTLDKVDPEALKQAMTATAVFAYQLARSTDDFGRAP
jgi:Zn-dependent M28 family amino/carboxypeptidase